MHQRDGMPKPPRQRPQDRQRDAVLAAQRDKVADPAGLGFNRRQAARNVAKRQREVATIRHAKVGGRDPMLRVLAVRQHPAGTPYRRRTVARAGAVGGADVHRDARDNIIGFSVGAATPRNVGGTAYVGVPAIGVTSLPGPLVPTSISHTIAPASRASNPCGANAPALSLRDPNARQGTGPSTRRASTASSRTCRRRNSTSISRARWNPS